MKDNKVLKVLVPLAAIVIILESVLLLSRSEKKIGPQELKEGSGRVVGMSWIANNEAQMGVSEEITLKISATEEVAVDAIDLYIKYDPTKVTVSSLAFDNKFVKPSFSKISQEKGMVVVNYLVSSPKGFALKSGVSVDLAKLKVNYISEGEVKFEVVTGTLVVENASAKVLPFYNESLVINVSSN